MTTVVTDLHTPKGALSLRHFWCPGCECGHIFRDSACQHQPGQPVWSWNGNRNKPTVSPSILVNANNPDKRCHLYLVDGQIRYLNDCHHHLRGQVVDMAPDPTDEENKR